MERVATERLHQLIAAEAAVFGPHEHDEDDEPIMDQPVNAVLQEWVLITGWTDLETGRMSITRTASAGLPPHHEDGLLHRALHHFD